MYIVENGVVQITNHGMRKARAPPGAHRHHHGHLDDDDEGSRDSRSSLVIFCTLEPGSYFGELAMLTSQRRTGAAQVLLPPTPPSMPMHTPNAHAQCTRPMHSQAATDCILSTMRSADFSDVVKDFPRYYEDILEGAMAKLEATLQSHARSSVEVAVLVRP